MCIRDRVHVTEKAILQKENPDLGRFHRRPELGFLFVHDFSFPDPFADIDDDTEGRRRSALRVNLKHHRIMAMPYPAIGAGQPVMNDQRGALPRAARCHFGDTGQCGRCV